MAGLGRKVFNSGDILLASEVQGYLQDQAVMVFDDSATRATAIGTANFSEGMASYLKDTDQVEVYDGSVWNSVGGDSGLIHINTSTFSAVSAVSIPDNSFTIDYTNYKIMMRFTRSTSNNVTLRLRSGGSDISGANYAFGAAIFTGTNSVDIRRNNDQSAAEIFPENTAFESTVVLDIFDPLSNNKTFWSGSVNFSYAAFVTDGVFDGNQIADSLSFLASGGTITGSVSVYGYAKV